MQHFIKEDLKLKEYFQPGSTKNNKPPPTTNNSMYNRAKKWYYNINRDPMGIFYGNKRFDPYRHGHSKKRSPNPFIMQRQIQKLKRGDYKEWKKHDTATTGALSNTGTITCLSQTAQGDQNVNREGLEVTCKNIQWKLKLTSNAASNTGRIVRCIIFTDTQQYGVDPTVIQLLETADEQAWKNHSARGRFSILRDFTVQLNPNIGAAIVIAYRDGFIKVNRRISYKGTTAAEASNSKGSIYVCLITNASADFPQHEFNSRMRFTG